MSDRRALLSVSDRTSLVDLATALVRHGYTLLSTGGTAAHLEGAGLPVRRVEEETGFPEILGGRVKTLHPKLFGGILMRRDDASHLRDAGDQAIAGIDLVVVNLYPFEETVAAAAASATPLTASLRDAKAASDFASTIEKIDVGGPSLLRAAAKCHAFVGAVCDPSDYEALIRELDSTGGTLSGETRLRLAAKAFRRTAAYDAAIASWFADQEPAGSEIPEFPGKLSVSFQKAADLRYGENPHQKAAFYVDGGADPSAFARFTKLQGKELSYNNLLDADAALFSSRSVGPDTLTIVKHRIATGIATDASPAAAFEAAWLSDPVAGFGGVVAYTGTLDETGATVFSQRFLEVVVVNDVTRGAREVLARKPNLRILLVATDTNRSPYRELRGIDGGLLVQEADRVAETDFHVVTRRVPTETEMAALRFAARAVRGVLSNAIVVTGPLATFGIGGGRTSRVDACRDAVAKAGVRAKGAVAGSDAFFPFPDGLLVLADAGVTAVVQPGGSVKDQELIEAADSRGLAMVLTGTRHFRH